MVPALNSVVVPGSGTGAGAKTATAISFRLTALSDCEIVSAPALRLETNALDEAMSVDGSGL